MTLNHKELIEIIAETIWNNDTHKGVRWSQLLVLNDADGYLNAKIAVKTTRKQAQAVLMALQDNLPEITLNLHEDLTLNEEKAKLWDKLKMLGVDNV